MNKFIGYYRSKGVFHAENGKDIPYDNVAFTCVRDLTTEESSGVIGVREPVRISYEKFKSVTGLSFEDFRKSYPCDNGEVYNYDAQYTYNEYGALKIAAFMVC